VGWRKSRFESRPYRQSQFDRQHVCITRAASSPIQLRALTAGPTTMHGSQVRK
jgi:hypothetical protein